MEVTVQQRALLTPKVTQPPELGKEGARVFILALHCHVEAYRSWDVKDAGLIPRHEWGLRRLSRKGTLKAKLIPVAKNRSPWQSEEQQLVESEKMVRYKVCEESCLRHTPAAPLAASGIQKPSD